MEKAKQNFSIRGFIPGDENAINDMFNEVFNQNRSIEHWYWKYRDNPYGSYFISIATSAEGNLAAHYAGYPVKVSCYLSGGNIREFTAYQLGDKMTKKEFRGSGFGKKSLISRTYSHFKETYSRPDTPFAYGLAAGHSYRLGKLVMGYRDIEPVPYLKVNLNNLGNLRRRRLERFLYRISIEEVNDVDNNWSDLFHRVAPSYKFLIKRDETYLRWRYLKRPDRKYQILALKKRGSLIGWSVFFREGSRIIWGDALFQPQEVRYLGEMFLYLKSLPDAEGVNSIECWFSSRPPWWAEAIRGIGFVEEPEPQGLYLTAPIVYDEGAPEMLKRHLYYTMGDSDLF